MAHISHVIIAARDLQGFVGKLASHHGLASYPGGRLAGLGTESHIVPLGEGFLEVVSIADEREAASNPFGRAVTEAIADSDAKFLSWAVNAGEDIDAISERLEMTASPLTRALPDGGHTTYNVAGLQQAMEQPPLPFFVQWLSKEDRPDQHFVDHTVDPVGFAWVELACDKQRLKDWLDDHPVPLQYVDGHDEISAVGITVDEGEPIILRAPLDIDGAPTPRAAAAAPASAEANEGDGAEGEEEAESGQPSTFVKVLDSIENAIESAAGAMEAMAGGITSPRELGMKEAEHES